MQMQPAELPAPVPLAPKRSLKRLCDVNKKKQDDGEKKTKVQENGGGGGGDSGGKKKKKQKSKKDNKTNHQPVFNYSERIRELVDTKGSHFAKELVAQDPQVMSVINLYLYEFFGQMCGHIQQAHRIDTLHLDEKERRIMPKICLSSFRSLVADAKAERKIKKFMPAEAGQD